MRKLPQIAILALQGAFAEHRKMLESIGGVETFEIRQSSDLERKIHALILPGGESTVQGKLLRELGLFLPLQKKIAAGLPVLATCAGIILLAEKLENDPQTHFATLPVSIRRNAYGRQLSSFYTAGEFGDLSAIPMPFIRAPQIIRCGENVQILSEYDHLPTAVKFRNQLAMTFHPEITDSDQIHRFFLKNMVLPAIKN